MSPLRRLLVASVLGCSVAVVAAAGAGAHVHIHADGAVAGERATIDVEVPNERSDTATVKIDLRFPEGGEFTDVEAQATGPWTPTVTSDGIVWEGGELSGSDEVALVFSAVLPVELTTLEFKTLQTYSDGEVVRWIESTPPDGSEPEFPAPVLTVAAPVSTTTAPGSASTSDTTSAPTTAATTPTTEHDDSDGHHDDAAEGESASASADSDGDDGSPLGIIVAVAAVVAALGAGGVFLSRRSRSAT